MTESTKAKIPRHLRKFIVEQNYSRYTPEDQAIWRFIMRQLIQYLSVHAHDCYLDGLKSTGISPDSIPDIDVMDQRLEDFGWSAVPVSGFIPPAAFMEMQSLGVLPIASDLRALSHLMYTPAPDIVHEAAGHAPILVHPEFSSYLHQYGEVARRAILSREDLDQYEAIRILSDVKEDPRSTEAEIQAAELKLNEVNSKMSGVSEAGLLSRMNWWTAEYGLVGDLKNPKIFGAGLLSSVGESRLCLSDKVKKIPLTVDCVDVGYDITEPQPQLFVTSDFSHLTEVLNQLAERLAFKKGGTSGLATALKAKTVNTVMLDSGLQVSGQLESFLSSGSTVEFIRFTGPVQLSYQDCELSGHGTKTHAAGFSSPLGLLADGSRPSDKSFRSGERIRLNFQSGIAVDGEVTGEIRKNGKLIVLNLSKATVKRQEQLLYSPDWGPFDMAIGESVNSVFAGPADRSRFGATDEFVTKQVPPRNYTKEQLSLHDLYRNVRRLRDERTTLSQSQTQGRFDDLVDTYLKISQDEWLPGIELLEIASEAGLSGAKFDLLNRQLLPENFKSQFVSEAIRDGLELISRTK